MKITKEIAENQLIDFQRKYQCFEFSELVAIAFKDSKESQKVKFLLKFLGYKLPNKLDLKKRIRHDTVYVKTKDNFHGNYDGDKVRITWYPNNNSIVVSGDDDYSLILQNTTKDIFLKLLKSEITKENLKKMGFKDC